VPSIFFHKREIGRGVPDVGIAAKSARLRAFLSETAVVDGAIQSTNGGVGLPDGAGQTRAGSLAEAVTNVAAGFLIALLGQQIILPLFAIHIGLAAHFGIASLFTLLSLIRSYVLRRLFNSVTRRQQRIVEGSR